MPMVAMVNETFARTAWPDDLAVGKWLEIPSGGGNDAMRLEVVGVVADVQPVTPGEAPEPEIYWSNRQLGRWGTLIVARTRAGAQDVVAAIRETLERLDPTMSVGSVSTMDELLQRPLSGPRFNATVAGVFAVLAGLLTSIGLYAVLAYGIARGSRTIGLRMAMGASPPRVFTRVLREAGALVVGGLALGVIGALGSARLFRSLVHGVSPADPASLLAAAGLLLAVSFVAAAVPARRAATIDPSRLLREE